MARLTGKLTPKALGWDRGAIATAVGKIGDQDRIKLGRFVGIVSGFRETVNNDTGEIQRGLKGQFRGVSTLQEDGKDITVTSGVCYLPGGIQEMIEGAFASAHETDKSATVQFGLDLYAIRAANKAGYSFNAENLVEAKETDPLDTLLQIADETAGDEVPAITDQTVGDKPEGKEPEGKEPEPEPAAKKKG